MKPPNHLLPLLRRPATKPLPTLHFPRLRNQNHHRELPPRRETPVFASNYPVERATAEIAPLLVANGGNWRVFPTSGEGLERDFRFGGFRETWAFMNIIAAESMRMQHHPEWVNCYNTLMIRWTTHSPPGLSEKDVLMARFCDEHAAKCGEVQ